MDWTESNGSPALAPLREIARALSTVWDLDATLQLITQKTTTILGVDSCSLYLLEADGHCLRLRASTGLSPQAVGVATLPVGEGMTGYAVQQNRPVYAASAPENPHFKWVRGSAESSFQSLLAVPLNLDDKPLGAINVQTIDPHEYGAEEIEFLALIADLAAGALYKAQLHDHQQQQIAELQALAEVSELATSLQYMDDILDVVTEMTARVMQAAVCSLFLINEAGTHLELRSAKRNTNAYLHRPPLPVGQGVIGQVALTGRAIYIPDVRSDPRYLRQELARREGLVSLLAVPLSVHEHVVGVLVCYTATVREFSPEQRALFMTMANQTALALEHARLMTSAAIVREMNHRIKNNLQTVAMLMQLQMSDAQHLDARQVLTMSMHRVYSIASVHDVLSDQGLHLVDLKEVLSRLFTMVQASMVEPRRNIELHVSGEPLLLPGRIATNVSLVVNELVQNACEHAFKNRREGAVEVSLGQAPAEFVISVRDNGSGLPADYTPGLGTEIVTTLVKDELRGDIHYAPCPAGTEVIIRMPRR